MIEIEKFIPGLVEIPNINPKRLDQMAEISGGKIIAAPMLKSPVSNIEDLEKGAIIAGVLVEGAPQGAFLPDGSYSINILRDYGTWIALFKNGDKIAASTMNVRVVPTEEEIKEPLVVVFGFSPLILVVFLAGVIVGMLIAK
jgi:hypothetical protein